MNLDELGKFLGENQGANDEESGKHALKSSFDNTAPAVKLVPRPVDPDPASVSDALHAATLQESLHEIEMAQRLGYLLCKCTWPPQIMVLTGTDHIYRCRRCSRVREM